VLEFEINISGFMIRYVWLRTSLISLKRRMQENPEIVNDSRGSRSLLERFWGHMLELPPDQVKTCVSIL
jgi:hypothetical protein